MWSTISLPELYHIGVDPLDEKCGFPSVRITHCLVDVDTAKITHLNHSSLEVLQKLVLRQVLLVKCWI